MGELGDLGKNSAFEALIHPVRADRVLRVRFFNIVTRAVPIRETCRRLAAQRRFRFKNGARRERRRTLSWEPWTLKADPPINLSA
jgi:hypothetical protein